MSDVDVTGFDEPFTSIVLIRHGESVANANRLIGGPRSCQGLSDAGRAQVEALARRLKASGELDGCVLMASHYCRAIDTASVIGAAIGAGEPIVDAGFGELDPGEEVDPLSYDELVERYGVPAWPPDPDVAPFPGSETLNELYTRVVDALDRAVAAHRGRTIAVATHGGVVDAALRHATAAPVTGGFDLWTTNTSLTGLTKTPWGRWRIDRYNDAAHLLDGLL